MDLHQVLVGNSQEILDEAMGALARAELEGYQRAGEQETRNRLETLLTLVAGAVRDKNLAPIVSHAQAVAEQRHSAGYDLSEIQTAFNVLEEAVWRRIVRDVPPDQLAEALGLTSTVLGAGKDALARAYVSLVSRTHAPSLNLQSLFSGAT